MWTLINTLGAQAQLTPWQKSFKITPKLPPEELYDMENDPWSMNNLSVSAQPEHRAALAQLRLALEKWITDSDDQGRFMESPELAAALGFTRPQPSPDVKKKVPRKNG